MTPADCLSLQIEDALEGLPGFKSVTVLDFRSGLNRCPHIRAKPT